jgi:hypothetical protein
MCSQPAKPQGEINSRLNFYDANATHLESLANHLESLVGSIQGSRPKDPNGEEDSLAPYTILDRMDRHNRRYSEATERFQSLIDTLENLL